MRILRLTTIIAGFALCAVSASAQTTTPTKDGGKPAQSSSSAQPASKQPTQGLPQSMSDPKYGDARKQKTSGVPASLAHDPQYGGAQKQD